MAGYGRSPKKDPQRSEVYRWEDSFRHLFYAHGLRARQAHALERQITGYYGIPRPRLRAARWGKSGYTAAAYDTPTPLIVVNEDRAQFTGPLLAHELGHLIVPAYGHEEPDHGPLWLGVYLHVLDAWQILPATMTVPSARSAGLKFRDPAQCGPKDL